MTMFRSEDQRHGPSDEFFDTTRSDSVDARQRLEPRRRDDSQLPGVETLDNFVRWHGAPALRDYIASTLPQLLTAPRPYSEYDYKSMDPDMRVEQFRTLARLMDDDTLKLVYQTLVKPVDRDDATEPITAEDRDVLDKFVDRRGGDILRQYLIVHLPHLLRPMPTTRPVSERTRRQVPTEISSFLELFIEEYGFEELVVHLREIEPNLPELFARSAVRMAKERETQTLSEVVENVGEYLNVGYPSTTSEDRELLDGFLKARGETALWSYIKSHLPHFLISRPTHSEAEIIEMESSKLNEEFIILANHVDINIIQSVYESRTVTVHHSQNIAGYTMTFQEQSLQSQFDFAQEALLKVGSVRKRNKRVQRGCSTFALVSQSCGSDEAFVENKFVQTDFVLSLDELLSSPLWLGVDLHDQLLSLRDNELSSHQSYSSSDALDDPELYRHPRSRRDSGSSRNWQYMPVSIEGDFIDVSSQLEVVTRTTLSSQHQTQMSEMGGAETPQRGASPISFLPQGRILRSITTQACQTEPLEGNFLRQELRWWNVEMDSLRSVGTSTAANIPTSSPSEFESDFIRQIEHSVVTDRNLEVAQVIQPATRGPSPTWGIQHIRCPNGRLMNLEEAVQRGIINLSRGVYIDPISKDSTPLPIAIQKGLVTVRPSAGEGTLCALLSFVETRAVTVDIHTESYLITGVLDQLQRSPVDISTALNAGLVDWNRGFYYNNRTKDQLQLSEAFRLGYLRGQRVTSSLPYVRTVDHSFMRLSHNI